MDVYRYEHPSIVGTFVNITMHAATGLVDDARADRLDEAASDEFERLEQILSVYRRDSELERWKRGQLAIDDTSPELRTVLREALEWQHRSGGAFHTASGAVTDVWRQAAERGSLPPSQELATVVASIAAPAYTIDGDGLPRPTTMAGAVNLNAFAKGWIVDRVSDLVLSLEPGLAGLTISAGGDLRHRGSEPIIVGVENPLRPYDNEPPLVRITLGDGAVATSGRARKGFRVGDRYFSHVIDPRTGATVDRLASVTVVADDAATADVLATVIGLADPDTLIGMADDYDVAVMAVLPDGAQLRNDAFERLVRGDR